MTARTPRPTALFALVALLATAALAAAPPSTPQVSTVPDDGYHPIEETPLELSDAARRYLLRYARQLCGGDIGDLPRLPPAELADIRRPIIITLFHESGQRRVRRRVDGDGTLAEKLRRAMPEVCAGLDGKGALSHYIHLLIVTRTVRLPNFGFKSLFQNRLFEPQVMGVAFEYRGKRSERDPIEQVMYNHGPQSIRRALMDDFGLSGGALDTAHGLIIEFYEVIHLGERYPDFAHTEFFRGVTRLTPEEVTPELLRERIRLIGEWYRHNIRADGQVTYEYSPASRQEFDSKRTMVRSTMAVWILNRLAQFLGDAELARLGQGGIDYYLDRYFQIEKSRAAGRIIPSTQPLANGNLVDNRYTVASFIAAAIMERPDYAEHRADIELLMRYAMSKMRPDGTIWTQFAGGQYFEPGQLLLVVSYAAEKLGGGEYKAFFDKALAAYGPALRGQMALAPPLWVPYAPAWYTQPAAHMYHQTKDPALAQLVFAINDRVARHHAYNAEDQRAYDYDGAMTPKRGYFGNNSVTAASLEALADAALVARAAGDTERYATYTRVIRHVVAYLLRLQFTPANTWWVRDRERVLGGFKTDLINQNVWMDNVWHLTSAFIKIEQNRLLE
ncbi:MAG: hypothetical protein H6703_03250 [Myxococcales bacterium]|nr:hypothetical protein [Myxococcales bacterium]MCB9541451.1 hypothetical protein [Myxococcales bacterium]